MWMKDYFNGTYILTVISIESSELNLWRQKHGPSDLTNCFRMCFALITGSSAGGSWDNFKNGTIWVHNTTRQSQREFYESICKCENSWFLCLKVLIILHFTRFFNLHLTQDWTSSWGSITGFEMWGWVLPLIMNGYSWVLWQTSVPATCFVLSYLPGEWKWAIVCSCYEPLSTRSLNYRLVTVTWRVKMSD